VAAIRGPAFILVVAVLLLGGCGGSGSLGSHAFAKDVDSIRSLAAEGELVARQVAHGETTGPFIRTHAGELHRQARSLRGTLETARVSPELAGRLRRAVLVAARVERALDRLRGHSGDRDVGLVVAGELRRAGAAAARLAA
jgi:hypothetical protein